MTWHWTGSRLFARCRGAALAVPLFFVGAAAAMPQTPQFSERLERLSFDALPGWAADNHQAALSSLQRICSKPELLKNTSADLVWKTDEFKAHCPEIEAALKTTKAARTFLETHFAPYRVVRKGFVTGYFEPELRASRQKTAGFQTPLHRKPSGLEAVSAENRPHDWPSSLSHGRLHNGVLTEMPDRGAIMDGALDREALELVWLESPIDAFFVHVQGSARLRLDDGSVMRVGYAGKTGHPYTGVARLLVKRGEGTPEDFTMSGLRTWLEVNPDRRDALLKENRSYIFFREVTGAAPEQGPVGSAGIALSAGRSLAVDPSHIPFGALVFVSADFKDPETPARSFARLMVADDSGSAIKGPVRGDIFAGSGQVAGDVAGDIRHEAEFVLLLPNTLTD